MSLRRDTAGVGAISRRPVAWLVGAVAACSVAAGAAAAPGPSLNACSYAEKAPVIAAVRTLDARAKVTFGVACRVTVRPSFGGGPRLVLGGAAYPANQFEGRMQLFRSGGEEEEDELTKYLISRVPRLKNAYFVREVYKQDGELSRQLIMLKLPTKMIMLTDLGYADRTDAIRFLRPTAIYAVARQLR